MGRGMIILGGDEIGILYVIMIAILQEVLQK